MGRFRTTMHQKRELSIAMASALDVVDVAFLAIRTPHRQLGATLRLGANILYQASAHETIVRMHLVADQPARPLLTAVRLRVPVAFRSRWFAHSTLEAPRWVARLHRKLVARGCQGPVCDIYMLKPLLHLYLPNSMRRVIFLDSDVFLWSDIAGLWRRFATFGPRHLIALAREENAFGSQEAVTALGGLSSNGGVELLDLQRMRDPAHGYTELLWRYARRDPSLPLNGKLGVGIQGEQVLYSWMSINGTLGHAMFHRLPCSWNVQVGSWTSHVSAADADAPRRRCATANDSELVSELPARTRPQNPVARVGCHLLHGAGGEAKALIADLSRDPSGRSCNRAFDKARRLSRHYPRGSPSEALFIRVQRMCCT